MSYVDMCLVCRLKYGSTAASLPAISVPRVISEPGQLQWVQHDPAATGILGNAAPAQQRSVNLVINPC